MREGKEERQGEDSTRKLHREHRSQGHGGDRRRRGSSAVRRVLAPAAGVVRSLRLPSPEACQDQREPGGSSERGRTGRRKQFKVKETTLGGSLTTTGWPGTALRVSVQAKYVEIKKK